MVVYLRFKLPAEHMIAVPTSLVIPGSASIFLSAKTFVNKKSGNSKKATNELLLTLIFFLVRTALYIRR